MDYRHILNELHSLTESELRSLNYAVCDQLKQVRNAESARKRRLLAVGDEVSFTGRNGYTRGTIVRVKRKYALVSVGGTTWNVPINMLEVAGG